MTTKQGKSTRAIAMSGVFLALSIVTLFIAVFIPGIELTLFAISSFYVAFIITEVGARGGWLFYAASVLLSFLIIPNKAGLLPYAFFFGLYGIIKYYIERLNKIPQWAEIILKLLFFNVSIATGIALFKEMFIGAIEIPELALPLLIIAAQVFFLFYDYIFTLVMGFYGKYKPKG